eukprot:GABV01011951.1.p1 GENE.GABV01011951.1~~GABV01011951.1.p1  ORF type:complete len:132 (-),score=28.11 GABV01011951.1:3-371(-)
MYAPNSPASPGTIANPRALGHRQPEGIERTPLMSRSQRKKVRRTKHLRSREHFDPTQPPLPQSPQGIDIAAPRDPGVKLVQEGQHQPSSAPSNSILPTQGGTLTATNRAKFIRSLTSTTLDA